MVSLLETYEHNPNTPKDIQDTIIKIAGVKAIGSFEKYLGVWVAIGRIKATPFQYMIDKT